MRAAQAGVLREILAKAGDWRAIGLPVAYFSTTPDELLPSERTGAAPMVVEFEVT